MKLPPEHLYAKGFSYHQATPVGRVGRTFDAVAKAKSEYEVVDAPPRKISSTYSPPVNQFPRSGAAVFLAVAQLAPAVPEIDVYV